MSKQRTKIVKELDPQELEGYSKAHIEHYLSLGYRPYLNEHGHIKWLTPARCPCVERPEVGAFRSETCYVSSVPYIT